MSAEQGSIRHSLWVRDGAAVDTALRINAYLEGD
jgi:hypothetical protein